MDEEVKPFYVRMGELERENKVLKAEVGRLKKTQRWIPVGEKLPEVDTVAWGYSRRDGQVYECWLDSHGQWRENTWQAGCVDIDFWQDKNYPEFVEAL